MHLDDVAQLALDANVRGTVHGSVCRLHHLVQIAAKTLQLHANRRKCIATNLNMPFQADMTARLCLGSTLPR